MNRAMIFKELRDTRGIAALALAAYGYCILMQSNRRWPLELYSMHETVPFIDDWFEFYFFMISLALAIALGLRQTLGESIRGTYPLLLHRPASRRRLFGVKLLVGIVLCLACGTMPIVLYGLWAATPGRHASPFFWAMTVRSWQFWMGVPLFYLGAFLTGIRPGRWWGSRLWPLVAALASIGYWIQLSFWWGLAVVLIGSALAIASIFLVAQSRDY